MDEFTHRETPSGLLARIQNLAQLVTHGDENLSRPKVYSQSEMKGFFHRGAYQTHLLSLVFGAV